jgi:hypothetical protein
MRSSPVLLLLTTVVVTTDSRARACLRKAPFGLLGVLLCAAQVVNGRCDDPLNPPPKSAGRLLGRGRPGLAAVCQGVGVVVFASAIATFPATVGVAWSSVTSYGVSLISGAVGAETQVSEESPGGCRGPSMRAWSEASLHLRAPRRAAAGTGGDGCARLDVQTSETGAETGRRMKPLTGTTARSTVTGQSCEVAERCQARAAWRTMRDRRPLPRVGQLDVRERSSLRHDQSPERQRRR